MAIKKPKSTPEASKPAVSGTFLGALRSELDEPDVIPAGFLRLSKYIEEALKMYVDHRISRHDLALRLQTLHCKDDSGGEWTLGTSTSTWYRRQGAFSPWLAAPAPSQLTGDPLPGEWDIPFEYGVDIIDAEDVDAVQEVPQSSTDPFNQELEEAFMVPFEEEKEVLPPVPRLNEVKEDVAPVARGSVVPGLDEALGAFLDESKSVETTYDLDWDVEKKAEDGEDFDDFLRRF